MNLLTYLLEMTDFLMNVICYAILFIVFILYQFVFMFFSLFYE